MLGVEAPPPAPPDDAIASANNVAGPSSDGAGEIKLVFLDIDGVICCNGIGRLEPDKLARIGEVCKRTDAKVVLSTDWRRDAGLKAMCTDALHQHGCTVIGATRKGPPLQPIRPKEIWGWLQSYQNEKNKRVSQWVAIDDRALLMEQGGENLKGHFVGTNFATGLTDRCMERCVQPKLIAIPWSDLVIEGDVASGAFGAVSKGSYNRVPVAVKRLHPRGNKQELLEEVETMRRMRHPNLLAMMGLTANPADQTLGVVMEFLPASLHSVLHSRKYHAAYGPCLTWQGCFLAVATDVAQGMHHLHLCGFVHRDLKPGNILLSEGWTAKVADFGEVQREANRAMGGTGGVAIQAPNSDGVNAAPTAASLAAAAAVAPKQRRLSLRARANQALKSPETPTNATSSATTTPATTAPNSAHSTVRNSPAESPANTMGHALQMLPSTPAASAACVGQPAAERRIHGTPPYISPEGASAGTALPLVVGPPTDVWSFGCVLAHIAARSAPYTKTMVKPAEVVRALRDGSASPLADLTDVNIPAELRALAESCCQWSADARPTFGELCKRLSSAEMVQAVCGPSEEAEDDDEDGGEARRPAIRLKWYSEKRAPSEVKPKPGEPSAAQQAAAAAAEEEAKLLDC